MAQPVENQPVLRAACRCACQARRSEIRQPLKPNLAWRILLCAYRRTLALFGNPKVFFDVKIGGAKRQ